MFFRCGKTPVVLCGCSRLRGLAMWDNTLASCAGRFLMSIPPRHSKSGKSGFRHWMRQVIRQCSSDDDRFDINSVHDLRVALRHCVSIGDGLSEFDPNPGWKRLKHSAKRLLKRMGELRDVQVLLDWLKRLDLETAEPGSTLERHLEQEETRCKAEATDAVASFDRKDWRSLARRLSRHAESVEPGSLPAQYVVLRGWEKAFRRHCFALRSRSRMSFHRLRIAIKDFRYSLEFFMPVFYSSCAADLKCLQDALGECHDLDVLWGKISGLSGVSTTAKSGLRTKIETGRRLRITKYLAKAKGKRSLWVAWRAALPHDQNLEECAVAALALWASFRSCDFIRDRRAARLALELYDALASRGFADGFSSERTRYVLEAAAVLQGVGRSPGKKEHHKRTYRIIRRLPIPIGWKPKDLRLTALIARYAGKALPQEKRKEFRAVSKAERHATFFLSGILRIANCFAQISEARVRKSSVDVTNEGIVIRAYGIAADGDVFSELSETKHLLEIACRRSIVIIPGGQGAPLRASHGVPSAASVGDESERALGA